VVDVLDVVVVVVRLHPHLHVPNEYSTSAEVLPGRHRRVSGRGHRSSIDCVVTTIGTVAVSGAGEVVVLVLVDVIVDVVDDEVVVNSQSSRRLHVHRHSPVSISTKTG
jgi:hypothetical protein